MGPQDNLLLCAEGAVALGWLVGNCSVSAEKIDDPAVPSTSQSRTQELTALLQAGWTPDYIWHCSFERRNFRATTARVAAQTDPQGSTHNVHCFIFR